MHPPTLKLCGAEVEFRPPARRQRFDGPLIYKWTVLDHGQPTMIYVGKARGGQSRPLKTYPAVIADLRLNRGTSKISDEKPTKAYFKRQPWGFRWVHHQLEHAAHRKVVEDPVGIRIILEFPRTNVPPCKLNKLERHEIKKAKRAHPSGTVVANDQQCMVKQPLANLASVWR